MEQLNKIELRGTVGSVRLQTYNDSLVAHFTVVTNFAYKDRDGSPVIDATWHNVTAWEGRDIPDLRSLEKGSKVYILGRIRNQKYTASDGTDRFSTEIVARRLVFVDDQLQSEMA